MLGLDVALGAVVEQGPGGLHAGGGVGQVVERDLLRLVVRRGEVSSGPLDESVREIDDGRGG